MDLIILIIYYFFTLLQLIILVDVILSWTTLLGFYVFIWPIRKIVDPIYNSIRKIIPTKFWPIEFAPLITIFLIDFLLRLFV